MVLLTTFAAVKHQLLGSPPSAVLSKNTSDRCKALNGRLVSTYLPWEPITFIFRGYDPYVEGLKPSLFMVLGSKGS